MRYRHCTEAAKLLALCTLLVAGAAGAQTWQQLSAQQQQALAPLQPHWDGMAPERRQKWLELATRFPGLSGAERERMHERMVAWAYLPPADRGRARQEFQTARKLGDDALNARWQAYQALPAEQREALARRARTPAPLPVPGTAPAIAVRRDAPPLASSFQQPGLPKIATSPDFVEPATLLPRRGAQGAARAERMPKKPTGDQPAARPQNPAE